MPKGHVVYKGYKFKYNVYTCPIEACTNVEISPRNDEAKKKMKDDDFYDGVHEYVNIRTMDIKSATNYLLKKADSIHKEYKDFSKISKKIYSYFLSINWNFMGFCGSCSRNDSSVIVSPKCFLDPRKRQFIGVSLHNEDTDKQQNIYELNDSVKFTVKCFSCGEETEIRYSSCK